MSAKTHKKNQIKGLPRLVHPLFLILIITSIISGCSGLQSLTAPAKKSTATNPVTSEQNDEKKPVNKDVAALLKKITLLEQKIARLEAESRKNDQTFSTTLELFELNLIEIKKNQSTLINNVRQVQPSGTTAERRDNKSEKQTPELVVDPEIDIGRLSLANEIETPETSKAIETISLFPLKKEEKAPEEIENEEEDFIIEENAEKPVLIESVPQVQPRAETFSTSSWDDPDLEESENPVTLSIIPGAKRQYQNAFKIYSQRKYSQAVSEFQDYISRFPDDQDTDNAQYWIGQSQFRLGNYLDAEQSFRNVLKNYKHGDTKYGYKTPDSILMLGRIYLIQKMPIKARYYFQQVVSRFPTSISASKAQKEIQAMNTF